MVDAPRESLRPQDESPETPPQRSLTRRILRGAGFTVAGLFGFVVLTLVVALVGANVDPGRRFIERQALSLTGGMVKITGLSGRFPDALHIQKIELHDAKGAWLTLDNLVLDWSPLALVGRSTHVEKLAFDRLAIPRLPATEASSTTQVTKSSPTHTGLSIRLDQVDGRRIEVGAPVAGVAAALSLSGHARIGDLDGLLNGVSFAKLPPADVAIDVNRLDAAGRLTVAARTEAAHLAIRLSAQDGKDGFVASMAKMPELTPLAMNMTLSGPTDHAALDVHATAGAVTASVTGALNLLKNVADINASVRAPAMTPMTGVSWNSVALDAKLNGAMSAPSGNATLAIDSLVAGSAQVGSLAAQFDGLGTGQSPDVLHLHATANGLRIPGGNPTLLAAAPVQIDATFAPGQTTKPATLDVSHPLLHVTAQADTAPAVKGRATADLPDLAPLAAMGGQKLGGHAAFDATFALPPSASSSSPDAVTTLALNGTLAAKSGLPQAVALIGDVGKLSARVTMHPEGAGKVVHIDTLTLDGRALHLSASGDATQKDAATTVEVKAALALPDLSAAAPSLRGSAKLDLAANGPTNDLAATAHLATDFGTATMPKGPLTLDATLAHLPGAPSGHVTADGTLDKAPLALDLALAQDQAGTRHVSLNKFDWNSAHGEGALDLPAGRKIPLGTINLRVARLADLRNLIGQPIAGALSASVHTTEATASAPVQAAIKIDGNAALAPYSVGKLSLSGVVTDPENAPSANLTLALDKVAAPSVAGSLNATVKGPQTALATTAQARFSELYGAPGQLDLSALVDVPGKQVRIDRLAATAKGEALKLLAPAKVSYGEKMGVDHLRLTLAPPGVAPATIDVAGTMKPALAVTASVRNLTPALARPFAPTLHAAGSISADAALSGALAAPRGKVTVQARDLRMLDGDAASLPPAHIDASANLGGANAAIDARIGAGPKLDLSASGTVPLSATGPLNVRSTGALDLSLANAVLGASGRQALGELRFALNVAGTAAKPDASGTVTLHGGDVQDFAQGVHIQNIEASIAAQHDTIAIQSFTAKAGAGTIALAGTVGAFAPGMPVNLHFTANKAQPVASDLLTAIINSDIVVKGQADTRIDVAGSIDLPNVEINIPNSMPGSVATLNVVRPGDKPPAPETTSTGSRVIALDIAVKSPGSFFVRGHGLDAEMAGKLHVGGVASAPQISGGFDMRRGIFDLAGISLNFTRGKVAFNGSGVNHKLDPTLDFEAQRNVNGQTAMLKVGGYASDPKISFDSIPSLPQDQVLAMLLFGTDAHSLSSTQMAEIGVALATLTGGSAFDPLGAARKSLGLDRLAIGGGSGVGNGGTSIEAGKYVMKGVYVGAKQATSGSGSQAQVQVDLTKQLKLNTTVGTGGTVTGFTTPENDPGSSVGLLWQYRY
ncbi:hypothetical protein AA23498_2990 [Acetobacter nitrogenifigens DSM 23921 = NBRC 105050]|uniref:Translocation and assembly module TamB C-terminal domain-containing protein n=1 Tax=Acetobacter nitrogenifigens DSM 23921 = NBRC 105050 TaxID=1120919 RepID=A0A511XA27_9PROT|nr:translocation/assembly module TamB domain-containing protein [Acetobacter nitrogenifigens]GBQ97768.1 hypothetical protein AA23498_2990 [Acetobacter nitrogenifigens DSM 23921 = NBRC 105050]GEN59804.1 hypothetical protein ANI02nite_16880 [Acetobacter nitrogenifigens DSM 23921 = NBRC 105050]